MRRARSRGRCRSLLAGAFEPGTERVGKKLLGAYESRAAGNPEWAGE